MYGRFAIAVAALLSAVSPVVPAATPVANADFETCALDGWTQTGDAFSVRSDTTWFGGTFDQHGKCFLSGYLAHQDGPTGSVRSATFTATDRLSFLVAGGNDPDRLHVDLVRAADGAVLDSQTGYNSEQLARIVWNTGSVRGQQVYLQVVDQASGDWGHLNLDDVRTSGVDDAGGGLTYRGLGQANQPTTGSAATRYAADPLRPQYHYTPYQGWINDPVGLIQWRGQYQLFAQNNPARPFWGPMHWSHASGDGARLTELPVALTPPPAPAGDNTGEWSGSAVDDNGVLTLFYTHYTDPAAHPGSTTEQVWTATSTDGVTFTPSPANPVIAAPPADAEAGFRDPKVFRDPVTGGWTMIVGSGHAGAGKALRYSSPDLRTWTYRGVLLQGDGSTGGMWECPTLIQVDGRWVLLVSTNGGVHYFTGNYDGTTFTPAASGVLDAGPHFYAAQAFADEAGRALLMGWMNNSGAFDPNRLDGWSQSETVLRQLFVKPDGTLGSKPADQLTTLHDRTLASIAAAVTIPPGAPARLAAGDSLDVQAGFDLKTSTASSLGLNLFSSSAENVKLTYDVPTHRLTLDTTSAGLGQGGVSAATVQPDADGVLRLRVLTDRSSVEVFGGDGTALTSRVYPRYRQSNAVSVFAIGGAARVASATVWSMRSAWL